MTEHAESKFRKGWSGYCTKSNRWAPFDWEQSGAGAGSMPQPWLLRPVAKMSLVERISSPMMQNVSGVLSTSFHSLLSRFLCSQMLGHVTGVRWLCQSLKQISGPGHGRRDVLMGGLATHPSIAGYRTCCMNKPFSYKYPLSNDFHNVVRGFRE